MPDPKIARFATLLEKNPDNALFRFSLAQALDKAERSEEALDHYQQCAQGKADWMMPRILLGKLQLKLGQTAAARVALEEALQLAIDQSHEDPEAELRALLAAL
jgi:Flp pilus assembly protein TadD